MTDKLKMPRLGIGLRPLMIGSLATLLLAPTLYSALTYSGALTAESQRFASNGLQARGDIVTDQIARRLYSLWFRLQQEAKRVSNRGGSAMRDELTLLPDLDERISWIGLADVGGTITVCSKGVGVGMNVAGQTWFKQGLLSPYVGDMHHDDPFEVGENHPSVDDHDQRILDFAVPVSDLGGNVVGALGAHVKWDWLAGEVASLENSVTDILLISRDRDVLAGPAELVGTKLNIGAAVAANHTPGLTRMETWPDGKDYLTVVVPTVKYKDLPNFGWSIVLRRDVTSVLAPTQELVRGYWRTVGIEFAVTMALLIGLALWVAAPIRRLSEFARRLAAGEADEAPHEEARYREAASLSTSLVHLQSQIASRNAMREAAGTEPTLKLHSTTAAERGMRR